MRIYPWSGRKEEPRPQKPTAFDVATRLVLPVALVLAALQTRGVAFWGALALAVLSFSIGLYGPTAHTIKRGLRGRRDKRVINRAYPEFKRSVERFGEFVDSSRADTLEQVVLRKLCQDNQTTLEKLGLTREQLFGEFSFCLNERIARGNLKVPELMLAISELNSLVNNYIRYCVQPVFEHAPEEIRPLLTADARRELESFRERFVRFLDDYSEYLKRLDSSLTSSKVRPYHFPRPKAVS